MHGIKHVPQCILDLPKLKRIETGGCDISHLPLLIAKQHELNKKEALRRIGHCKKSQKKNLDLSRLYLSELPEELSSLYWLERLNLSNNTLKQLPDWIGNFQQLTYLDLDDNELTSLPNSIGGLRSLKTIRISFNQLQTLLETFGNLVSLEVFNLSEITNHPVLEKKQGQSSWFTHLPDSFCNLVSLKYFILDNTKIKKLPENFGGLTSLKYLCIQGDSGFCSDTFFPKTMNGLKSLREIDITSFDRVPFFISEMKQLTSLDLSHNKFYILPEFIGNLTKLKRLNLHSTWITEFPEWISNLKNLVDLDISNNDINVKPAMVTKLKKLKNYCDMSNPFSMK